MKLETPTRFYYDTSFEPRSKFLDGKFPLVVLDPGCREKTGDLHARGIKIVLAYTSAIEMAKDGRFYEEAMDLEIPTLGVNPDWGTLYMDMTSEQWIPFYRDRIAQDAADKGYAGVVLDTFNMSVDINNAGLHGDLPKMLDCMCRLVSEVRKKFGSKFLIVPNGGWEEWKLNAHGFQNNVDAMLVESYRTGSDFSWLKKQVKRVLDADKPVLAIEYGPMDQAAAKMIVNLNRAEGIPTLVCASKTLTPPKVIGYSGKWKL